MAMTASVTRSRRAEGLHLPNQKIANAHHRLLANAKDHYAPRPKRQLDPDDRDRDFDTVVPKKPRFTTGIAVEIPARQLFQARFSRDTPDSNAKPAAAAAPPPRPPSRPAKPDKPAVATPNPATSHRAPPANGGPKSAPASIKQHQQQQKQQKQQPALTKHQEKVANGLKHELNRLQPNAAATKEQGRKLRSQEATRFKSELSAYFPEYDEVIGNDPKETHLLNPDTPIVIIPDPTPPTDSSSFQRPQHQQPPHPYDQYPVHSYHDNLYTDLYDAQRIDFSFLNKTPPTNTSTTTPTRGSSHATTTTHNRPPAPNSALTADDPDPLPSLLFEPAHKKAERLERSIRNSEKGRAQHEKDQIIRLLDGLQSHDWLRVMGVSGITESKKRAFEPAREHFIRGCEGILGKFKRWAREEKRRKVEMLERRAEQEEDGEQEQQDEEDEDEEEDSGEEEGQGSDEGEEDSAEDDEQAEDEDEPPDESDVDASIAKQLREEALAAAAKKKQKKKKKEMQTNKNKPKPATTTAKRTKTATTTTTTARASTQEPDPPREFTSFFSKRYQREAALARGRRKGRNVLAWGRPVPDLPEAEFCLPADVVDEDVLRTHARRKRRDKRLRGV